MRRKNEHFSLILQSWYWWRHPGRSAILFNRHDLTPVRKGIVYITTRIHWHSWGPIWSCIAMVTSREKWWRIMMMIMRVRMIITRGILMMINNSDDKLWWYIIGKYAMQMVSYCSWKHEETRPLLIVIRELHTQTRNNDNTIYTMGIRIKNNHEWTGNINENSHKSKTKAKGNW